VGCSNDIVQADIAWVYYREDYDTDGQRDYVFDMFASRKIGITKLDPTPEEISFSKMLADWRMTWTID
jgi:deoxycytidylate deaminase